MPKESNVPIEVTHEVLEMMFSRARENAKEEIDRYYGNKPLLKQHMIEGISHFQTEFNKLYEHHTGQKVNTQLHWGTKKETL